MSSLKMAARPASHPGKLSPRSALSSDNFIAIWNRAVPNLHNSAARIGGWGRGRGRMHGNALAKLLCTVLASIVVHKRVTLPTGSRLGQNLSIPDFSLDSGFGHRM